MKKFVVIYHAPADAWKHSADTSPEDMKKGMEAWMQWAAKCGDKLVDMGSPLVDGIALNPNGTGEKSNKNVAGYSVLQAENMEDAKALLAGHPHLNWNAECTIELHETMPPPGM